jgi:PAS domain S-box-containing protein
VWGYLRYGERYDVVGRARRYYIPNAMSERVGKRADLRAELPVPEGLLTATQYRAVFEAAPDGIVVVDAEGLIRDMNPRAEELFGYERGELVGKQVETLVPASIREAHERDRSAFLAEPRARPMGMGLELRGRRSDGSTFPVEISLSPWRTPEGLFVISTVRDVTQRRRLRQFGLGALRAAEEERRRIARELHDDTAQRLAAILLRLHLVHAERSVSERERLLDEVRSELVEASEAVRRTARGLRPPALEEVGVVTALRAHVRSREDQGGPSVELDAHPVDEDLDEEGKLVLYRVVQEALSNVMRHADASRVGIRIAVAQGRVTALVEDDGCGFDPRLRLAEDGRGLGLIGMRERAALVGGSVSVESAPGAGTRVRLEIPVRPGGTT